MTSPSAQPSLSFDIFCQVVDNYGDIGVCWRLTRQLAHAAGNDNVRLWINDLDRFKTLEPGISTTLEQQTHCGIDIVHWHASPPPLRPHQVVIEAFGCTLPEAFITTMLARNSLWLNLEYLSAETWVDGFHLQPSLQANGLRKYFFFPGFSAKTGGLLREPELIAQRDRWQSQPSQRRQLLQACGLSASDIAMLDKGAQLLLLFCYPDAPVPVLIKALANQKKPCFVLIPDGVYPITNIPDIDTAGSTPCGTVHIRHIPFVNQSDFDRLLWSTDLNIVRGEDSMVRALWAARPMIWQPYRQDDNTHRVKLDAWLARSPLHPDTQALIRSWTTGDLPRLEHELVQHGQPQTRARWLTQSRQWSAQLAKHTDLVTALMQFSTQQA